MSAGRRALNFLENSSAILVLSVILGLSLPGPAKVTEILVTPALMIMMAFSLAGVRLKGNLNCFRPLKRSILGLFLNYGLLSGLILFLSYNLSDVSLRQGFVIMAAVPPAVAVLPMTRILAGDIRLSLSSEILSYIASLLLMPLIIYVFCRQTGISPLYLVEISIMLVFLPALASRLVGRLPVNPVLPINLCFFLVTYTVIGLNYLALRLDAGSVVWISLARTFGVGLAVYALAAALRMDKSQAISYMLLASFKNLGLAAAVSLMLFGPDAGVPAAFCVLAETAFFILLTLARPSTLK